MSKQADILKYIIEDLYPAFEGMDCYFKSKNKQDFNSFCHGMLSGGISMYIRNTYGLWDEESENHKFFKEVLGIEHPDDMSAVITGAIWDRYHNKLSYPDVETFTEELSAKEILEKYKDYLTDEQIQKLVDYERTNKPSKKVP